MNQTDKIFVFTDAATSPQAGVAIGVFLYLEKQDIEMLIKLSTEKLYCQLATKAHYQQYESNKSTWSEIKTVIHALESIAMKPKQSIQEIELYTDCQNICDLLGKRKEKLEKNNFITRSGRILQHATLYKELYAIANQFQIETFKVKGHQPKILNIAWQEKIFSIIDKLGRKKLRSVLNL